MAGGPCHRIGQETFDLRAIFGRQMLADATLQDIGPGRQRVQFEIRLLRRSDAPGKALW